MFSMFRKIGWYIKANWVRYLFAIIFLNLASVVSVISPKLLEMGIDQIANKELTEGSLIRLLFYMFLSTIGGYIVALLWNYLLFGASMKLEYTIRRRYFKHLLKMDNEFFKKNIVGDLMARATSDLNAVSMTAGYGILTSVDAFIYLIMILAVMMYTISFKLTIVSLIPILFIIPGVKILGDKTHKAYAKSQIAFSDLNNKVLESVTGVRVVRAYVQEQAEIHKLKESGKDAHDKNTGLIKINALFDPVFRTIFTVANTIAFAYGAYLVFHQQISPGQLVSFILYLGMLGWPMFALGDLVNVMSRGNASYERINNIMTQIPEVKEPDNPSDPGEKLCNLEFRDVTFSYPRAKFPALDKVSFKLEKGATLGIVGKTGSGKTSIVRQILKQYDLLKGRILINNINIKLIKTAKVRSFFGYVPQEHMMFTGSVYKNIAFGKKDAAESEVQGAIDLASFRKDVVFLDNGLDTIVGEQGVTLSGGQKQRLSIARAFVMNPEVLILDDSLSAVDGTTEKEILKNIKQARRDKTTIIIAHRLSAVEHADEIIVLHDGKIIERGNHTALMALNGWYSQQYARQQMLEKTTVKPDDIS